MLPSYKPEISFVLKTRKRKLAKYLEDLGLDTKEQFYDLIGDRYRIDPDSEKIIDSFFEGRKNAAQAQEKQENTSKSKRKNQKKSEKQPKENTEKNTTKEDSGETVHEEGHYLNADTEEAADEIGEKEDYT